MIIKTPVKFTEGATISLVDAEGTTIFDLDSHCVLFPETRQAIIDAFEDAARWRFLQAAFTDPDGSPEGQAMTRLNAERDPGDDGPEAEAEAFAKLIDAARAELAK